MTDFDILLIVIWGAVCWILGRWYQTTVIIRRLISNSDQLRSALNQLEQDTQEDHSERIPIRAEWVGDQVYLYVTATNEFLAQGPDVDTAIDRIVKFTPGCDYVLPREMAEKPTTTQP